MKSIFKGKILKKVYWFGEDYTSCTPFGYQLHPLRIQSNLKVIETPVLLTLDIKEPVLSKGDKFYNHENDNIYLIEDAMRGTEDNMVYFTDVVLETIIDEESKTKAESDKVEYKKEELDMEKRLKEHKQKFKLIKEPPKKSWLKRLFN